MGRASQKLGAIVRRELRTTVLTWRFLALLIGYPALLVGLAAVAVLLLLKVHASELLAFGEPKGVVDHAGVITGGSERFLLFEDEAAARRALLDGRLGTYVVVPPGFPGSGPPRAYARSGPFAPYVAGFQVDGFLVENLLRGAADAQVLARIQAPGNIKVLSDGGPRHKVKRESVVSGFLLGIFLLSILISSGFLSLALVQEKEERIYEVLLSSVPLERLVFGKAIGLGLAGALPVAFWSALVALVAGPLVLATGVEKVLEWIPAPEVVLALLAFYGLSYAAFALQAVALSALGRDSGDVRAALGMAIMGVLQVSTLAADVGSYDAVSMGLAILPPFSAFAAPGRLVMGSMPAWAGAASLGLLLLFDLVLFKVVRRLLRTEQLIYGKGFDLRAIWKALREA